ncbi:conserved hypothetical protein [Alkaliphilus metalliredigens QYMF]|uniref:Uncharacterized protein n=1 Tax=Alkaliphilus metalliredigens (strain QYMF) TaxID=293826 RepID=A6TWU6_ALKMQ|nr:membrane protein [Alkaliphilus metalliredigens]ABR50664.1 conserved hypothetical protein [Alkaliphilus metalliredigens QYMF]
MNPGDRTEKLLWSIALPGFGQLLNGHLLKGFILIALEFIINVQSNLNVAIVSSFQFNTQLAVEQTNYQWLMFYPCIYMFAIWDAYKYATGISPPYSFLPFILAAYFGTIGVIYSSVFKVSGALLGPVWLPILGLMMGVVIGLLIKAWINSRVKT